MSNKESANDLYLPSIKDIGSVVADVTVVVSNVIFEKNGFFIFACRGDFSVKGSFSGQIVSGLKYKITGTVGLYGKKMQITATSIAEVQDDDASSVVVASFLKNHFEGLGEKTSLLLAKEYGMDVLEELHKRPVSVSKKITGLSDIRAKKISDAITEDKTYLTQILKLRVLGLTEDHAKKAYEMFGIAAADEVKRNPYILMRINGIGFDTCEYLSREMELDKFDRMRVLGAILSVLNEIHYSSGNTYITKNELVNSVKAVLFARGNSNCDRCENVISCDMNPDHCQYFDAAFANAVMFGVSVDDIVVYHFADGKCAGCGLDESDARIAIKRIFKIEYGIKKEIDSFVNAYKTDFDDIKATKVISRLAKKRGIDLDSLQIDAIKMAMQEPICIITGGPGTGKTTITGILAEHFKENKIKSLFCAPTGRASKRLAESIEQEAHTIHRLLEVRPSEGEEGFMFGRNQNNPLEARVVVVDEASMVDNALFLALLRAISPNSSLILIGDPNQLPSVGPGNLLADLLSCKSVPRVELSYIFRQANESSIAANAYRILNGESLIGNDSDFRIIDTGKDDEALEKVFELYDIYKNEDLAILCPTKQNDMGTVSLNKEIQNIAADLSSDSMAVGTSAFYREYDKVMQIKNDYNLEYIDELRNETGKGVYNGEIGIISSINTLDKTMEVVFDDGKKVRYDSKTLSDIDLAYAMTVHKAQGCEFDTVVIVLGKMSYHLFNRNLLYTAVTRGKKRVVIINLNNALNRMIKAVDKNKRQTSLGDLLKIIDKKKGVDDSESD